MKIAALIPLTAALAIACPQGRPVEVPQTSFDVPDFPGSGRSGYSSEYAPETMHKLSKAQQDMKSRNLDLKFRELTPPRPTSFESVTEHYSAELAKKGLRRSPDQPIEGTSDSFAVWDSETGVPAARVLATCIPTRDPGKNPCAVLLLVWGVHRQ